MTQRACGCDCPSSVAARLRTATRLAALMNVGLGRDRPERSRRSSPRRGDTEGSVPAPAEETEMRMRSRLCLWEAASAGCIASQSPVVDVLRSSPADDQDEGHNGTPHACNQDDDDEHSIRPPRFDDLQSTKLGRSEPGCPRCLWRRGIDFAYRWVTRLIPPPAADGSTHGRRHASRVHGRWRRVPRQRGSDGPFGRRA